MLIGFHLYTRAQRCYNNINMGVIREGLRRENGGFRAFPKDNGEYS